MYTPAVDGFSVRGSAVRYAEVPPPDDLGSREDVLHFDILPRPPAGR